MCELTITRKPGMSVEVFRTLSLKQIRHIDRLVLQRVEEEAQKHILTIQRLNQNCTDLLEEIATAEQNTENMTANCDTLAMEIRRMRQKIFGLQKENATLKTDVEFRDVYTESAADNT